LYKVKLREYLKRHTYIACSYHAWLSLKVIAKRLGKMMHQVGADLFGYYLRAQLRDPAILAYWGLSKSPKLDS
jgi:hypothetical protein